MYVVQHSLLIRIHDLFVGHGQGVLLGAWGAAGVHGGHRARHLAGGGGLNVGRHAAV